MGVFLSPAALTVVIGLAILLLIFHRRLIAFLTQPVPNPNYDPNAQMRLYWMRSHRRMNFAAREMELLERLSSRDKLNGQILTTSHAKLRKLADEQRAEVVPHPALEEHKQAYYQLLDIQARKVEDAIATGGANSETLIVEEEAFWQQTNERRRKTAELYRSLGVTMPDFSDPSKF